MTSSQHFDDPVAAYGRLAPHYAALSNHREPYLRSIEQMIVSRIPPGSNSLLDIGAGNGIRTLRIARDAGIQRIVLVEPSQEMSAPVEGGAEIWKIRAEDLDDQISRCFALQDEGQGRATVRQGTERFQVIICLWNVLGHIRDFENRVRAMRAMRELLAPEGKCFIDVNHRYNLRSYGIFPTFARLVRDSRFYNDANADVLARWNVGGESISTHGHVFADKEIRRLSLAAGLSIEERIVVDYDNGKIRRFALAGNLLYVFRLSSRIDSSSAARTS